MSEDRVRPESARALNRPREEQQRPVKVDRLIREIGALMAKQRLDLEAVDDKAEEATGR
jgi:hypothetical protein